MEPANKALWSALKRVARPERPLDLLRAIWSVVLGPRMAAHTRPVAWNKGTITIEAFEPEWRTQLEQMTGEIRKQINRWWGTELVHEVRISTGRRGAGSGATRAPGAASRGQGKSGAAAPGELPAASSDGDRAEAESKLQAALKDLEPSLRGIADEDLRDLIARVASKYLAGRQ
jgi:hypothetical protein